jgi:hypothetical protein
MSTAVFGAWSRTLQRVLDDGDDALKLFRGEVTGTLGEIDIGLLADQVGVPAADTLYLGQGVHDLLLAIDVCVQQTDDVLEAVASQHNSSKIPLSSSMCLSVRAESDMGFSNCPTCPPAHRQFPFHIAFESEQHPIAGRMPVSSPRGHV